MSTYNHQNPPANQFINTINLSKAPSFQKEKLYSFISENKIQFNRDENGETFAMVKFEHPETKPESQHVKKETPSNPKLFPSPQAVLISLDILSSVYQTFFALVNPLVGIRAKKITLYDLKYQVEEFYSVASLKYAALLKSKSRACSNKSLCPFPYFVHEYLSNKYPKKTLFDQTSMNLLLTLEYFKAENEEVRLFSQFLSEEYPIDDVLFFLLLRSNVEKESGILLIEKAKDETKIQHMEDKEEIFRDLYLSTRTIAKIVASLYDSHDEIFYNQVMYVLEPYLEKETPKSKTKCITSTNFLLCLTDNFHLSKLTYEDCQSISNVPFLLNKQNEFFDINYSSHKNTNNEQDMFLNMLYYFNNQTDSFEDNVKKVLITYIKEKEILPFFEKHFEQELNDIGNEHTNELNVFEIRNDVLKKLYALIHILFYNDFRSWNVSLGNDADGEVTEEFKQLVQCKIELTRNTRNVTELKVEDVEQFCAALMGVPQVISQISKMIIIKKKQMNELV